MKKISVWTILLIIVASYFVIQAYTGYNQFKTVSNFCASMQGISTSQESLDCLNNSSDLGGNFITDFYFMVFAIIFTILSWRIDKLNNKADKN